MESSGGDGHGQVEEKTCSSTLSEKYSSIRNTQHNYHRIFCHSQAKLKLKVKLGWLDNQLKAATAVFFEPGALKLGAFKPGTSKPAKDFNFDIQDRYQDLGITPRPRPEALGLKP